jgi:hypothetical protein
MRLSELRTEIQQSAKNPVAEKAYPITSDWIPVTDVLAIVDRFEKEWRKEFESALAIARSGPNVQLQQIVQRITTELLA